MNTLYFIPIKISVHKLLSRKKILTYISDEELISRIYKALLQINNLKNFNL